MPILRSLMQNLKKQYGEKHGEGVYYAMENKAGGTQPKLRSGLKRGLFRKHGASY